MVDEFGVNNLGIIDYECQHCGCKQSYKKIYKNSTEYGECVNCGKLTFANYPETITQTDTKPKVECPYCHSTNTKKISTASKVGSVALFGIFAAGKVAKEWHCNDCKSDF